jgi:hypothetical protein
MAFLGHLGLNTVQKSKGKAKNPLPTQHSTGLANEPARTLPASRPWYKKPAFASGVLPGLVLVPIDAGGTPLRSPAKTSPGSLLLARCTQSSELLVAADSA